MAPWPCHAVVPGQALLPPPETTGSTGAIRYASWIQPSQRTTTARPAGIPNRRRRCIANMAKKKGFRSVNDGKAWRCRCGVVNQPTKHRFFNLPAFQCSQCQRKLKLDFKFCFGEVKANGKSVVGEVWDQDKDREFLFRTEVFVSARKNKLKFCSLVF